MTKERLIDLILHTPQKQAVIQGRATGKTYRTAENIADYLIANGVIVPPCKVGDTVYFACLDENCEKFIDKGTVYAISRNENILWFSVRYLSGLRYDHTTNDFGKTVFLTREDAEKALEEVTT